MHTLKQMRLVYAVASTLLGSLIVSGPAFAETGRLGNILDIPITYQAGVPDPTGYVAWQDYTLQPCEVHEWAWDRGGQPNIHFIWPRWRDLRKDEYGNVMMERNVIPMTNNGALTVFFAFGDQIWIDASAAATMDNCVAETPPSPPPDVSVSVPDVDLSDVDALIARAERGEILLIDINSFSGLANWEGPRIIPVTLEDFAILLFLAATLQDPARANEHMADMLQAVILQSRALIETVRSDRNALATTKH